jgi:hypothetical protein
MNLPASDQLAAVGRSVTQVITPIITLLVMFNQLSPENAEKITSALAQVGAGSIAIFGGLATVITVTNVIFSYKKTSPAAKIEAVGQILNNQPAGDANVNVKQALINAVAANPSVVKVVVDSPKMANDAPSAKVVPAQPETGF